MPIANSIVVHQPHFFPWPPYLAKIAVCENFVVQDDVQFRKGYFHNRTRLLDRNGKPDWITIPVHTNSTTLLSQTVVSYENMNMLRKVRNKLVAYYQGGDIPSLQSVLAFIKGTLFREKTTSLVELNIESIGLLLKLLGISPPRIYFASQIPRDASDDRTARLISIMRYCNAQVFVTGWGRSGQVHNMDLLSKEQIQIVSANSDLAADVLKTPLSMTGLSTLHWLLKYGPAETRNLVSRLGGTIKSETT